MQHQVQIVKDVSVFCKGIVEENADVVAINIMRCAILPRHTILTRSSNLKKVKQKVGKIIKLKVIELFGTFNCLEHSMS